MGGEVLELVHDRAERMRREALAQGIEQGLEQGIEQGLEQGTEKARREIAAKMAELGYSQEAIDEVLSR